jgi:hypothetical protein
MGWEAVGLTPVYNRFMQLATGTVVEGKVVVEGEALPEGARVTILVREADEPFEVPLERTERPQPIGRRDPLVDNPALAEAVRIGWITPAEIVSDDPPPRLPVAPLGELLKELDEDRADR